MAARIFIDGEHGTTGLQIRSRLAGRADIELLSIPEAERRDAARRAEMMRRADIAILCLPDDAAREAVAMLGDDATTRVIDTSTAHRVDPQWAYGFAELDVAQADRIRTARLVANPGCYPTGAIALLRPLRDAGILNGDVPIAVNAVSGYTGGGKQLIAQMEDATRGDHIAAPHFLYGLNLEHKHLPEMRVFGRLDADPVFAPAVGRFPQGMIVQIPLHRRWLDDASTVAIRDALFAHYGSAGTVEVADAQETAALARIDPTELAGTDRMRLFVFSSKDDSRINLVALLDNLGKGASGAAVQNMDLMLSRD